MRAEPDSEFGSESESESESDSESGSDSELRFRAPIRNLIPIRALAVLLVACAGPSASSPPARTGDPGAAATGTAASVPKIDRDLGPDATFADLVRAARVLVERNAAGANAQCVLSETAAGYRFDAELMPALDRVPEAPAELDGPLQTGHAALAVLSAWGVLGAPDAALTLAAFTATAPQRVRAAPLALLLTDEGVYVRTASRASTEADGPLPQDAALAHLQREPASAASPLFVTAEAAVPLTALANLLRAVPADRAVALAIALPAGTRLPAPTAELIPQSCPDGLPEPSADRAEGEIDARALAETLRALLPNAERCLANARGPGRAGGALKVALRIAPDGSAEHACLLTSDVLDAALISCVLEVVRGARYPVPSPAGFVDVHAPLRLEPEAWAEPRALCAR